MHKIQFTYLSICIVFYCILITPHIHKYIYIVECKKSCQKTYVLQVFLFKLNEFDCIIQSNEEKNLFEFREFCDRIRVRIL